MPGNWIALWCFFMPCVLGCYVCRIREFHERWVRAVLEGLEEWKSKNNSVPYEVCVLCSYI